VFKIGDIVTRKSYGGDILFQIEAIQGDIAKLRAINFRLLADAPLTDLTEVTFKEGIIKSEDIDEKVEESLRIIEQQRRLLQEKQQLLYLKKMQTENNVALRSGKVLHIDGDKEYSEKSRKLYERLAIPAIVINIPEEKMPDNVLKLLKEHQPDILVLTGHDGFKKKTKELYDLKSYRNSRFFVESVKLAREYIRDYDQLVIIAAACQSYYEELINVGANFASSPERTFIHALDPVFIVEKIAYTSVRETVLLNTILKSTISGIEGIGGLETRGKLRISMPLIGNRLNKD